MVWTAASLHGLQLIFMLILDDLQIGQTQATQHLNSYNVKWSMIGVYCYIIVLYRGLIENHIRAFQWSCWARYVSTHGFTAAFKT